MLRTEAGTSLIEVMTALFVLAVGILSVAQLQISSLSCTSRATRIMVDGAAAGSLVENLLALPLDDSRLSDEDDGFFPEVPDHGPFPMAGTGSTIEWEVEDHFAETKMKRIAVTVRWKDRNGRRSFTYESVRPNPSGAMKTL